MSVALLGRNSLILSLLLPALSRIGAHITLLNTDIPQDQLLEYLRKHHYQLFLYDKELIEKPQLITCKAVTTEELHHLIIYREQILLNRFSALITSKNIFNGNTF